MTTSHATLFLQRPEGRIAYDVQGEGPLVLCVPGMGDLRSAYRHLTPALVATGFRVATMDLRGHGDSDTTFSAYDDAAAGSDVLALIDALGGGPAVVVGNSMGAAAAAWAAAEREDAVAGTVLVGPFVREVPMPALTRLAFRVAMARPWAARVWLAYLPKLYAGRTPDDQDDHLALLRASFRDRSRRIAFARTTRTSHAEVGTRLGRITAPALVVMGELDPDFPDPVAEAVAVAGALGGTTEVLMVAEAGHYPQVQRPDVVGPAVAAFAREVLCPERA